MKFKEKYNKITSTNNRPSSVVADMIEQVIPVIDIPLINCDFGSQEELRDAVEECLAAVVNDQFLASKDTQSKNPMMKAFYQRAVRVIASPKYGNLIDAYAEGLWLRHFDRKNIELRRNELFCETPDIGVYKTAKDYIMKWYGWSPDDMERLRYFVCQAKRKVTDPVLNRSLYIYSKDKMTGKTTIAKIIAGVLNGWWRWQDIDAHCGEYMSDIATELQFGNFDKPKGCRFSAVVMDEAFSGKNTAKYYGKFKTSLTSSTCSVEVKFGGTYDVNCSRNYIFTSNNDVSSVVADESERRLLVIEMKKPKVLTYSEMVILWRDYIINCPDEDDVYAWYSATSQEVVGEAGVKKSDIYSAILSEDMIDELELLANGSPFVNRKTQVSFPSFFYKFVEKQSGMRNCELIIKEVVQEVFGLPKLTGSGQSQRRYYLIDGLISILKKKLNDGTI